MGLPVGQVPWAVAGRLTRVLKAAAARAGVWMRVLRCMVMSPGCFVDGERNGDRKTERKKAGAAGACNAMDAQGRSTISTQFGFLPTGTRVGVPGMPEPQLGRDRRS